MNMGTSSASAAMPVRPPRFGFLAAMWRVLRPLLSKPSGFIGIVGVAFFVIVAYLGPLVVPTPAYNGDQIRQPPSALNPFGTDNQGKSVLILLVRGGREVINIAGLTAILSGLIGITLGSLAAYIGGMVDRLFTGLANFILTIPNFILLAVLSTVVTFNNSLILAVILGLLNWPLLMRTVRSQVLSLREREYVEAAVSLGLPTRHIIVNEILPNMASFVIVNVIFAFTYAIYSIVGLLFLGLAPLNAPDPNWGLIIRTANTAQAAYQPDNVWWILAPVLAIALLQWFMITLARAIEDSFNPRLKTGG